MEEFVHHPSHAAAHANAIPNGALLQHRYRGADAVFSDAAVLLARAGAQVHAVAVPAPDGRVAYYGLTRTAAHIGGEELGHHIPNGAINLDAAPGQAAFQYGHRRAHGIGANHAVARAGARAKANAVSVVAGDVGVGSRRSGAAVQRKIVAVHIPRTAVRRLDLVPASALAQDFDHRSGVVAGDDIGVEAGACAQAKPSADHRGVLGGGQRGRGQDAQKHHRHQQGCQKPFHFLIPPISTGCRGSYLRLYDERPQRNLPTRGNSLYKILRKL